ncbi:hypothetical protein BCR33DRAFT_713538 [Rhizoclosmatium globosum]|uniref:Uncharacterized protein n=1 Tax=Rhizoclosmatium globosum TaxID=329046 RepID=A0A1Y2CSI1_9FUNG|nr:hypothetical protein BCR33DRAFT_713538 [Rhizoclosmatium globosum]|eukprot:ORY49943.1 hypothetical protein BCR33DRAFT_713538 [Rhizoclosmatium globosum]
MSSLGKPPKPRNRKVTPPNPTEPLPVETTIDNHSSTTNPLLPPVLVGDGNLRPDVVTAKYGGFFVPQSNNRHKFYYSRIEGMNPPMIADVSAEDQENLSLNGRKLWKSDLNAFSNKTGRFEPSVAGKRKYTSAYPCWFSSGNGGASNSGQSGTPRRGSNKRQKTQQKPAKPAFVAKDPKNLGKLIYIRGLLKGDAPLFIEPKIFNAMTEAAKLDWMKHKEEVQEEYGKRVDSLASGLRRMQ